MSSVLTASLLCCWIAPAQEPAAINPQVLDRSQAKVLLAAGHPLDRTDPKRDLGDLAAFGAAIGEARIVAVGDPAQGGAREVNELRLRLVRYLVEEKGFTVIALEAPFARIEEVFERSVLGDADPRALLPHPARIERTGHEGNVALVTWARRWRAQEPPLPVRLRGYGAGGAIEAALRLRPVLHRVDPDLAAGFQTHARVFALDFLFEARDQETKEAVLGLTLASVKAFADEDRLVASGLESWEWVRGGLAAMALHQTFQLGQERWGRVLDPGGAVLRQNLERFVTFLHPEEKVVILAPNPSIQRVPSTVPGKPPGPANLGGLLAEEFGAEYLAVGLFLRDGRVRLWAPKDPPKAKLDDPDVRSVEAGLAKTGPRLLVDTAAAAAHPELAPWMTRPHPTRVFPPGSGAPDHWVVPARDFDFLAFVRTVEPEDFF